jgi:hypothetical protein
MKNMFSMATSLEEKFAKVKDEIKRVPRQNGQYDSNCLCEFQALPHSMLSHSQDYVGLQLV